MTQSSNIGQFKNTSNQNRSVAPSNSSILKKMGVKQSFNQVKIFSNKNRK